MSARGFVYSFDALISVLVAAAALAALVYSVPAVQEAPGLRATAEAVLAVADEEGTLKSTLSQSQSAANSTLSSFLFAVLANNTAARFNVTVYSWSENAQQLQLQYSAGNATAPYSGGTRVQARRFFADPKSNRFGVVSLEVWRS